MKRHWYFICFAVALFCAMQNAIEQHVSGALAGLIAAIGFKVLRDAAVLDECAREQDK